MKRKVHALSNSPQKIVIATSKLPQCVYSIKVDVHVVGHRYTILVDVLCAIISLYDIYNNFI